MRATTDTYTGKPFRWNETVTVEHDGKFIVVPARCTSRTFVNLHPTRVPTALLTALNAEVTS